MFTIPTIPNDTIYKFIFFLGLTLIVYGEYSEYQYLKARVENLAKKDAIYTNKAIYAYKVKIVSTLYEAYNCKTQSEKLNVLKKLRNESDSLKSTAVLWDIVSDTSSLSIKNSLRKKIDELYLQETIINSEPHEDTANLLVDLNFRGNLYIYLGTILTIIGMYLWSKIQWQTDTLAFLQIQKLKKEMNIESNKSTKSSDSATESKENESEINTTKKEDAN